MIQSITYVIKRLNRKDLWFFVFALMSMIASALASIGMLSVIGPILSKIVDKTADSLTMPSEADLQFAAVAILAAGLLSICRTLVVSYVGAYSANRLIGFFTNRRETIASIDAGINSSECSEYRGWDRKRLISILVTDVNFVVASLLVPAMDLIAAVTMVLLVSGYLLVLEFELTIVAASLIAASYTAIYWTVKRRVKHLSLQRDNGNEERVAFSNTFGNSIVPLFMSSHLEIISETINQASRKFNFAEAEIKVFSGLPKSILESVLLCGVLYLLIEHTNYGMKLSSIGIFAIAALKLVPEAQKIYSSISSIRYTSVSFENLVNSMQMLGREDFRKKASLEIRESFTEPYAPEGKRFIFYSKDVVLRRGRKEISVPDIVLQEKEILGVTGPSGCGKSSLFLALRGLIPVVRGDLCREHLKSLKVSGVSQDSPVFPSDIYSNIAGKVTDKSAIDKVCEQVGLSGIVGEWNGDRTLAGLSGGQKQRMYLARALLTDPDLLLLDEFTDGLDSLSEKKLMMFLKNFSYSAVVISHRQSTLDLCDRVIEFK